RAAGDDAVLDVDDGQDVGLAGGDHALSVGDARRARQRGGAGGERENLAAGDGRHAIPPWSAGGATLASYGRIAQVRDRLTTHSRAINFLRAPPPDQPPPPRAVRRALRRHRRRGDAAATRDLPPPGRHR